MCVLHIPTDIKMRYAVIQEEGNVSILEQENDQKCLHMHTHLHTHTLHSYAWSVMFDSSKIILNLKIKHAQWTSAL